MRKQGIRVFKLFKKKNSQFISENQHKDNLASQLNMSPQTVEQLRGIGINEDRELKLEYFFYTNATEKAEALSNELSGMGYSSEFGQSAHDKKVQIVTGWSSPLQMTTAKVLEWTESMCNAGFKHDCEFDGWGTTPKQ